MTEQGGSTQPEGGRSDDGRSDEKADRTWYEEFSVSGSELLDKVKGLIREGNVRRVFIKNSDGATVLEIPLTAGVAITAVAALAAPILVAVGAVAALLTQATVGVERSGPATTSDAPTAPEPAQDQAALDAVPEDPAASV